MNLSTLHMNHSPLSPWNRELSATMSQPTEKSYYWHIERKTKHGWKFHRDFSGTKPEAAELWLRYFRHGVVKFRLHRMASY